MSGPCIGSRQKKMGCELVLVSVHHPLKDIGTNPIESNNIVVTVFCVVFDGKATRARPLVRRLFAKKSG